jgi:hypothetical protein
MEFSLVLVFNNILLNCNSQITYVQLPLNAGSKQPVPPWFGARRLRLMFTALQYATLQITEFFSNFVCNAFCHPSQKIICQRHN